MTNRGPTSETEQRHGLIGPFSGRQLATVLVVIVVAAGGLLLATRPIAANPSVPGPAAGATQYAVGPVTPGLRVGDLAPELALTDSSGQSTPLTDLNGNPVSLAGLRGHPVWLSFWASWCPPCQAETPVLRDLYNQYKSQGLVILAISVQEASASDVRAYAQRYDLTYPIAADLRGDVFREYRIYGLPTQFFIDSTGVIRWIVQGPVDADIGIASLKLIMPTLASPSASATGK